MPAPATSWDRSASTSRTFDIPHLVQLAETGAMRIPSFQRPFLWDASDVRKLFDSIYRGFPLGTLLLWRQSLATAQAVTFGPLKVTAVAGREGYTVVDGQQRLTSLVASLSQDARGLDDRFEVFFDLARRRFVGPTRGAAPRRAIPVREVLESRRLLTWLREHGDDLEADDLEVADELGGALRDYRIPAYVVDSDDEALLREVFDRMNSAGKRMSRAHVFHALFGKDTAPASTAAIREALNPLRFGPLGDNRIVQSVVAVRGGDVQRDIREEFGPEEESADAFEVTERALRLVVHFLQQQGVPHVLLVPSSFPVPVLAAFFHLHPDPDPWTLTLLGRWIWRGWVHGFASPAGPAPALRRAVAAVNPVKGDPSRAPDEFEAVRALLDLVDDEQVESWEPGAFHTDNADSRLVLLGLASLRPSAPDGRQLDLAHALEDHGTAAAGELVPGHRSEPGARAFWLRDWGRPTGEEDPDVLGTHAISPDVARALAEHRDADAVRLRTAALGRLTADMLNNRMAPGARAHPPLASLLVPDPPDES